MGTGRFWSIPLVFALLFVLVLPTAVTPRTVTGVSPTSPARANDPNYSGVSGYVYGDSNEYAVTSPIVGASVTVLDNCTSVATLSCATVSTSITGSGGFFGLNLTAGSGYYLSVSPDPTAAPGAPGGFGGTVQAFTAPVSLPLIVAVYPLVTYGNTTLVLPGYTCLADYVDNYGPYGPGCQNPVLSWTRDGAYYVNTTDELVFYSFLNATVDPVAPWIPLYQDFPDYSMIPNELFTTQDGAYVYSWGTINESTTVISLEAVNVTTDRLFLYNFTSANTEDVAENGIVMLTGWDGNDSQVVLIEADGELFDHDLWSAGETLIGTLPFFEANNIYWLPDLNSFVNVEADGGSGDYVEELQLAGPVTSSTDFSLVQTYLGQWTTASVVVNGVNGISFNVTSRELTVEAENSGIVYSVLPNGTISQLLLVTNLNRGGDCECISIGPGSESDRPALIDTGPEMNTNYLGYNNNSWLVSMTPGHIGFVSTNVSPYVYNAHASIPGVHTWLQWYQEGQFLNTSYLIGPDSYACSEFVPGSCTINGGDGAAVGTIWWYWKMGLPEFPFTADAPAADPLPPGPTTITSVAGVGSNATVRWTPPPNDTIVNYTLAWGARAGAPTDFASAPGGVTTFNLTGLVPNTRYFVSVEAWNLHFHGTSGGVSSFTTLPAASGLTVTGTTTTNISLEWTNPLAGSFSNLTLEYGTHETGMTERLSVSTVSAYTVVGLAEESRYYFAVIAWNGTVEGAPSNIASATTSFGATDLVVVSSGLSNVTLQWSDPPIGTSTNLSVSYGASPATLANHLSVGGLSSRTVSGLSEATRYFFSVLAWNGSTSGTLSNLVNATTSFGATGLTVTGATPSSVALAWSSPPSVAYTNSTVEFGTGPGALSHHVSVGTAVTYDVTGLIGSTTYYFEVVAWNGSSGGVPSNLASATTSATTSGGSSSSSSNNSTSTYLWIALVAVVFAAAVTLVNVFLVRSRGRRPPNAENETGTSRPVSKRP